jgi:hypothetical protein
VSVIVDRAVERLLASRDPSIRYLTLVDVLGESPRSRAAGAEQERIPGGPRVRALLRFEPVHPYRKWTGAHWRLVSLVELALPPGHRRALAALEDVLAWLGNKAHRASILRNVIDGRTRIHAAVEGNALAVCSRLGRAADPRARELAEVLVATQWPDGGWNCDLRPEASHSSFYESLATLWGLDEFARATGDAGAAAAVDRAAELFLRHRVFRATATGDPIDRSWLKLHYPLYWRYDVLQALVILARAGKVRDARVDDALDVIESKRGADGLWRAEARYWRASGATTVEAVDWGDAAEPLTLNALRVLRAAGRL